MISLPNPQTMTKESVDRNEARVLGLIKDVTEGACACPTCVLGNSIGFVAATVNNNSSINLQDYIDGLAAGVVHSIGTLEGCPETLKNIALAQIAELLMKAAED
jgi:hypothetical protein